MTELRLTLLLGPRETIEAAELAMPELPHVLAAAYPLEGWDADEVERLLMLAGGAFRQSIMERKHEEPPPPPKRLPAEVLADARHLAASAGIDTRLAPEGVIPVDSHGKPLPGFVRDTWGDPVVARDWPETEILGDKHDRLFNDILRELLGPPLFEECADGVRKARRIMRVVVGP